MQCNARLKLNRETKNLLRYACNLREMEISLNSERRHSVRNNYENWKGISSDVFTIFVSVPFRNAINESLYFLRRF